MPQVSLSEKVILNGWDLSCYLKKVGLDASRDLMDANVFCGAGAKKNAKGLHAVEMTAEGFNEFDPDAEVLINSIFQGAVSSDDEQLMMFSIGDGFTIGDLAVMLNLNTAKYSIDGIEAGSLIMASLSGSSTQSAGKVAYQHGVWLFNQTVTGATNGASYDNGASSTGFTAQIHVLAGDDVANVVIQHSTNNSVWVDLITNTTYEINTGTQIIETDDTVNRYVRVAANPDGTTNTVAVAMSFNYTGS